MAKASGTAILYKIECQADKAGNRINSNVVKMRMLVDINVAEKRLG